MFTTEEAISYLLSKARKPGVPMGKSFVFSSSLAMMKARVLDDGSIESEGWISKPNKDLDKDVLEPESFSPALKAYMDGGAPISVEHGTRYLPVGFLQKAVLVRDGTIIEAADNPLHDKAEFKYFDGGTGWYGLANIYDQKAGLGVMKGTVRYFSWIGMPNRWKDQPDGGRHFTDPGSIDPLIEVTLTGFPVNNQAVMRIAKAQGYSPEINLMELYANPMVIDVAVEAMGVREAAERVIKASLDDQNDYYRQNFPQRKTFVDYFK